MAKRKQDPIAASPESSVVVTPLRSTITAVSFQGLSIVTPDGNPATLAVVDQNGKIVEVGPSVMRAVWDVAIRSCRNFLIGNGHLRVLTRPPDLGIK
ncbi:hypothetical protein [Burkholderia cenocepacia]|uniref:hypothetical protein n=1 Tax=Burkholderia cenocepacia TaxID=95486 RepID=UPI000F5AE8FD|nr:hypothetical protein [Burkholderia cenocepacia]RQU92463.1 hypothetical protein DF040_12700 [Burkholderia cenocepacia]